MQTNEIADAVWELVKEIDEDLEAAHRFKSDEKDPERIEFWNGCIATGKRIRDALLRII